MPESVVRARIVRKEYLFARDRQTHQVVLIFLVKRTLVLMYTWLYLWLNGIERLCFGIALVCLRQQICELTLRQIPFQKDPDDHHSKFTAPYNFCRVDKERKMEANYRNTHLCRLHVRVLRGVHSADAEITVRLVSASVAGGVPVAPTM